MSIFVSSFKTTRLIKSSTTAPTKTSNFLISSIYLSLDNFTPTMIMNALEEESMRTKTKKTWRKVVKTVTSKFKTSNKSFGELNELL